MPGRPDQATAVEFLEGHNPCFKCPRFSRKRGNKDCIKTCSIPDQYVRNLGGMTHSVPDHMTTYGRRTRSEEKFPMPIQRLDQIRRMNTAVASAV